MLVRLYFYLYLFGYAVQSLLEYWIISGYDANVTTPYVTGWNRIRGRVYSAVDLMYSLGNAGPTRLLTSMWTSKIKICSTTKVQWLLIFYKYKSISFDCFKLRQSSYLSYWLYIMTEGHFNIWVESYFHTSTNGSHKWCPERVGYPNLSGTACMIKCTVDFSLDLRFS